MNSLLELKKKSSFAYYISNHPTTNPPTHPSTKQTLYIAAATLGNDIIEKFGGASARTRRVGYILHVLYCAPSALRTVHILYGGLLILNYINILINAMSNLTSVCMHGELFARDNKQKNEECCTMCDIISVRCGKGSGQWYIFFSISLFLCLSLLFLSLFCTFLFPMFV